MKIPHPSFWKTTCLAICVGWILPFTSPAQCTNNMATRSYDTVLTGIGYGTYQLHFPQWSLDSGVLASVTIKARVSVHYQFILKNLAVNPSTYSLWVGREDYISSPVMSSAYDNITEQKIGVFPLSPGEVLSQGPWAFLDNYVNTDSITGNTAAFLGTGSVGFSYLPVTYTTLHNNNNASYSYHASVADTVHFSLSYLYCRAGAVLATGLTRFSATLQEPATVRLDWAMAHEKTGRLYKVQRSSDGQHFTTVAILPATNDPATNDPGNDPVAARGGDRTANGRSSEWADYTYNDLLPAGVAGKWYYRLQVTDPDAVAWSTIREVTTGLSTSGRGLTVYPNPADDFVNLAFDPGTGSGAGWRMELLAADGRGIQSGNYLSCNNIHIDFQHRLPAGVYFIQATDLRSGLRYINQFVKR